ncbi:histidine phosphatase family protein [Roseibium sp.]|uniref:histidine phosphatase family protein n=1 Tax=Roseibium sp. TaxID=1936156 RepID=UPI003A970504
MSFCVYLTHPEVAIDPEVPVPDWGLSDLGRSRARLAIDQPWAPVIRHVVASGERKAVETAEIFASAFGLPVRKIDAMHENDRSSTGFLPPERFEPMADAFFANPTSSVRGWEPAADAQTRIVEAVHAVLAAIPKDDPVLFAGHGGVGTLLKCHLLNTPISRAYDQTGGGHWYLFTRQQFAEQSAEALDWIRL